MPRNESRTWRPTIEGGSVCPQVIEVNDTANPTFAVDFEEILSGDDALNTVQEIVEDGSAHTPTISGETVASSRKQAEFQLSGLVAGSEYVLRSDVNTQEGDRQSCHMHLHVV